MTGIEPAPSVWKTEALPLSYIRKDGRAVFSNVRNKTILWGRLTKVVLVEQMNQKINRGVA